MELGTKSEEHRDQGDQIRVTCVQLVIMDNLSSHKAPAVGAAIEAAGAKLMFFPPYSPDFNPIEMAFSKLKAHLREGTIHGLWPRPWPRPLLPTGVRKLLRSARIRCNLVENRSSGLGTATLSVSRALSAQSLHEHA